MVFIKNAALGYFIFFDDFLQGNAGVALRT
jgi:hypothetical protein